MKVLSKTETHLENTTPEIPGDGEVIYDEIKHCFYVGDGKTETMDLHPFNNIVKTNKGNMYFVDVNDDGEVWTKKFRNITDKKDVLYKRDNKTLKASELIKQLLNIIVNYGDLDVYIDGNYITNVFKESNDYDYDSDDSWIEIETDCELFTC